MRAPRSPAPGSNQDGEHFVPLRLIASQGGLGIELYQPQAFGPLTVERLSWTLPGLTFPVDLSGGVRSFRSRRGELSLLQLSVDAATLSRWIEQRLRRALGPLVESPQIWIVQGGIGVGFSDERASVAFDLLFCPDEDRARFVIAEPRAVGYPGPALAQVRRVLDSALGKLVQRRGRILDFDAIATRITRQLLPAVGVRTPLVKNARLSALQVDGEQLRVVLERDAAPALLAPGSARALSLALLTESADEALFAGDIDRARTAYMKALEHAPRHPEVCRIVAEIDTDHSERAEAALGLLVESLPATSFGRVGAELLARVGDRDGAQLAIAKAASAERYAPLAARYWLLEAAISGSAVERGAALDQAVAIAPASGDARRARFEFRLETGDLNGAVADAEHLEAGARGSLERHDVVVRCARAVLDAGYSVAAGRLFQRALRYAPRDAASSLGLALSLIETQSPERALVLLERAAERGAGEVRAEALLALGRLLALHYQDLPQAIARVREVEGRGTVAIAARHHEASWRAALGDVSGATLAYGRMRDTIDLSQGFDPTPAVAGLLEAARFATEQLDDASSAEQHLKIALRLRPRDPRIQQAFRDAARRRLQSHSAPRDEPAPAVAVEGPAPTAEGADLEARAEALRARFLADPSAEAIVGQLSEVLLQLKEYEQLHALLTARYEDSEGPMRERLRAELARVLVLLRDTADSEDQRQLYQGALEGLDA